MRGIKKRGKNILVVSLGVIILIAGYLFFCNVKTDDSAENIDTLTTKQWIADIEYLYNELPKKHKNLYHSMEETTFKDEIEKLKGDTLNLKGYEIKCRIAQIVALVKDAHTSVKISNNGDEAIYPITLNWFGNDIRVVSVEKDKKDVLGMKVMAINNMDIKEAIEKVNSLISYENIQRLNARNVSYLKTPEVLKLLNIAQDNKIELTLEDDQKNIRKVHVESKILNKDNQLRIEDELINKPLRRQGKDTMPDKAYWYKYMAQDKILYLQYNECIDYGVAKGYGFKNYKEYPKFDKFSKEFLDKLENSDVDKLIVDLRNNGGGNSELMSTLVSKIRKIEKLKGEGKIFVLMGKSTFSSAILNTLDFKKEVNAILIGEETGGNANHYGEVKVLKLPNSNIKVNYSSRYFKHSSKYEGAIVPDVEVYETFENYKKGIDEVYEAAKNYRAH